jgi:hypothetical protein
MKYKPILFALFFVAIILLAVGTYGATQQQKVITLPVSHVQITIPNSTQEMQLACFFSPMNPICLCKEKPYCIEALLYSIKNK